ncbi:MAG: hypothetical protein ACI9OJ_003950 [Myxococcota bacterium]|jgi:hypothetical protein
MPIRGLWIVMAAALIIGPTLGLSGCEDEVPSQPPPKAKPKKVAKAADKKGAAAKGAKAKAEDAASERTPTPTRVPTASQMLGLGRNPSQQADGLPAFINPKPMGESQLFAGGALRPSQNYASMKVAPIGVSPIERNWGKETGEAGAEAARRKLLMNSVAAPAGPSNTQIFGKDEPKPDDEGAKEDEEKKDGKAVAADERKYRLVMYRVKKDTGKLDKIDRKYASEKAMEAARQFANGQGYGANKPSPEELRKLTEAVDAKQDAAEAQAAKAKEESCKYRAQWSDSGIQQSRCFPNQKALNAFTAARLATMKKKADAAPKPKAPPKPTTPEAPAGERAIKPVKIGN